MGRFPFPVKIELMRRPGQSFGKSRPLWKAAKIRLRSQKREDAGE